MSDKTFAEGLSHCISQESSFQSWWRATGTLLETLAVSALAWPAYQLFFWLYGVSHAKPNIPAKGAPA